MKAPVLIFFIVLLVMRIFVKNKVLSSELKSLSKAQLLGVSLNIICTVIAVSFLIYYGGNWLAGRFTNIFLQAFSFLVIVFLVLSIVGTLSDKVMKKIAYGALPKN